MNEPIRHHFIPQFILRNFCFNNRGEVRYYCKKTETESIKNTRDVFMTRNLYRDEINTPGDPTKLEREFAEFEREVSLIVKSKLLSEDEITLSMEEDGILRLFFALMGFRSERVRTNFEKGLSKSSKEFFSRYQKNGDFLDFWKRNLRNAVRCRSIQEVVEHPGIDEPIKVFLVRDTFGYLGRYFVIAQRCESKNFIIGDAYPLVVSGTLPNGVSLELYSVFPLSPERILMMACRGADGAPRDALGFRQTVLMMPKMYEDGTYTIRKKRFYNEEVEHINGMIFKEAKTGVVFKNHC